MRQTKILAFEEPAWLWKRPTIQKIDKDKCASNTFKSRRGGGQYYRKAGRTVGANVATVNYKIWDSLA